MILNFESNSQTPKHWTLKSLNNANNSQPVFLSDFNFNKKYNFLDVNKIKKNKLTTTNHIKGTGSETAYSIYNRSFFDKVKKLPIKKSQTQQVKHILAKILFNQNYTKLLNPKVNTWYSNININFLRKERLYTKLKYSRSPAYDIVSGGAAAIFAGFIGFLISEKFGFELADSGDFYYLFMYIVFIAFFFRPIITSLDVNNGLYGVFKLKEIKTFYVNIFVLLFLRLKSIFFK